MPGPQTLVDLQLHVAQKYTDEPWKNPFKKVITSRLLALPIAFSEVAAFTVGIPWILSSTVGAAIRSLGEVELQFVPESETIKDNIEHLPSGKRLFKITKKTAEYGLGFFSTITIGVISPSLNQRAHVFLGTATDY